MPEYLAPGVFMEEVSYRSKSIEGVSTTTTGFVGPARYGPTDGVPDILTSLAEFEATFGDGADLRLDGGQPNYLWHAVRAFFEQGGKRLYVSRVADGATRATDGGATPVFQARHPGAYGDLRLTLRLVADADVVREVRAGTGTVRVATGVREHDVVVVGAADAEKPRVVERLSSGRLQIAAAGTTANPLAAIDVEDVGAGIAVRPVTASLDVQQNGVSIFSAARLPIGASSPGTSLERCLDDAETGLAPVTWNVDGWAQAFGAVDDLVTGTLAEKLADDTTGEGITAVVDLTGGEDGDLPDAAAYEGADGERPTGLMALAHVPEISIVAAPASAADAANHDAIVAELVTHVHTVDYRVAVLDGPDADVAAVRATRSNVDSTRAALYYPWVKVANPVAPGVVAIPPSGFVAGIYARNDVERGVWKAPANEVVLGALGFTQPINTARQEVLNPLGINCLRSFEGRGHRVWGARTVSSDPEWKYVNLRRYFNYLERSIDLSTQWAVFEPNGERLWANVRRSISDFLLGEFQMGALLGDKPEAAYFVKCDRSTMTQNDLDNGRLVCQVGVAALRPAEFVIFRIGQWTSDRRS